MPNGVVAISHKINKCRSVERRSGMGIGPVARRDPAWCDLSARGRVVRSVLPAVTHGQLIITEKGYDVLRMPITALRKGIDQSAKALHVSRVEWWIAGVLDRMYSGPEAPLDAVWCQFPAMLPEKDTWLGILYPAGRLALYSRDGDEHFVPLEQDGYARLLATMQGLIVSAVKPVVRVHVCRIDS